MSFCCAFYFGTSLWPILQQMLWREGWSNSKPISGEEDNSMDGYFLCLVDEDRLCQATWAILTKLWYTYSGTSTECECVSKCWTFLIPRTVICIQKLNSYHGHLLTIRISCMLSSSQHKALFSSDYISNRIWFNEDLSFSSIWESIKKNSHEQLLWTW